MPSRVAMSLSQSEMMSSRHNGVMGGGREPFGQVHGFCPPPPKYQTCAPPPTSDRGGGTHEGNRAPTAHSEPPRSREGRFRVTGRPCSCPGPCSRPCSCPYPCPCPCPSTCLCRYVWYVSGTRAMQWGRPPAFRESRALRPAVCGILGLSKALHLPLGQGQGQGQPGLGARPCVELSKLGK